jgi:hypothetical protein
VRYSFIIIICNAQPPILVVCVHMQEQSICDTCA